MTSHEDPGRRRFLGAAVETMVGRADRSHANARAVTRRHTPVAAAEDTAGASAGLGTPNQIAAGALDVGYTDAGPIDGPVVILLHGWPYDMHSFLEVVPLLVAAGHRVVVPHLRGFGTTRSLASDARRNGQQAALALDVIAPMERPRDRQGCRRRLRLGRAHGEHRGGAMAGTMSRAGGRQRVPDRQSRREPAPLTPSRVRLVVSVLLRHRAGERATRAHARFARLIWGLASPPGGSMT